MRGREAPFSNDKIVKRTSHRLKNCVKHGAQLRNMYTSSRSWKKSASFVKTAFNGVPLELWPASQSPSAGGRTTRTARRGETPSYPLLTTTLVRSSSSSGLYYLSTKDRPILRDRQSGKLTSPRRKTTTTSTFLEGLSIFD